VRLHVVRHPTEGQLGDGGRPSTDIRQVPTTVSARVSPDHPSVDHPTDLDATAPQVTALVTTTPDEAGIRILAGGGPSERRVITSSATTRTASMLRDPDGGRRPTPYESGLAAVARHEVHIERVWPMRSPSTGSLEVSSSAYFQRDRRGTPPARILPVEGLHMNQAFPHEPVMAEEVVGLFATVPPGLILDTTLGGGGHSAALLAANPAIGILGIDRDPAAVSAASDALSPFDGRVTIRRSRFDSLAQVVADTQAALGTPLEERGLSGALFDLGVSSPQLDVAERGFSYRRDAVLDMRMDPTSGRTAADVVNDFSEDDLVDLFTDNGEGRFARRIARAIVAARPLTTTGQLADVVRAAIPAATRRTGGHPARRVFQAIRIAVNEELDQLERALDDALALLRPGGRCVVISYHSGEDRLVKTTFHRAATDNCQCPPGLPCVCGADPQFRLVTRGARRPSEEEVARNRRAEAARLRVIERLPAAADHSNGEVA
jgi:16S rRNA (cytosine1402-N4)-methyltransferase